jgi:hypothetical protein
MLEQFVTLTCRSCGAKLDVYPDMDRLGCGYCGTELTVLRRGGTVSFTTVVQAVERVQANRRSNGINSDVWASDCSWSSLGLGSRQQETEGPLLPKAGSQPPARRNTRDRGKPSCNLP